MKGQVGERRWTERPQRQCRYEGWRVWGEGCLGLLGPLLPLHRAFAGLQEITQRPPSGAIHEGTGVYKTLRFLSTRALCPPHSPTTGEG